MYPALQQTLRAIPRLAPCGVGVRRELSSEDGDFSRDRALALPRASSHPGGNDDFRYRVYLVSEFVRGWGEPGSVCTPVAVGRWGSTPLLPFWPPPSRPLGGPRVCAMGGSGMHRCVGARAVIPLPRCPTGWGRPSAAPALHSAYRQYPGTLWREIRIAGLSGACATPCESGVHSGVRGYTCPFAFSAACSASFIQPIGVR